MYLDVLYITDYRSLCCSWSCLHYVTCTSTCLHYRSLSFTWLWTTGALLILNVSTSQGPELHLDMSGQQEPLLLLDVSSLQGPELHLDVLHFADYKSLCCSWTCLHYRGL
jgi:hypothetical protein